MDRAFVDIIEIIKSSHSIVLSTHKEPDGDGLGSELALYYALKKLDKKVRILNLDSFAEKYNFLDPKGVVQSFNGKHSNLEGTDLALILDTNDQRLIGELYREIESKCKQIAFVDHHPVLVKGPKPSTNSIVNTKAASTGEIVYTLITEMGVELDHEMAQALYTSIIFDTHLFRYIRNSSKTHLITAELLKFDIEPEKIHRLIFGDFTKNKLLFSARVMNNIEFFHGDKFAFLKFHEKDLEALGLNKDHTRDIVDTIMNIDTIEAAIVARENRTGEFKLSIRSKGKVEVLSIAEKFGGGGHMFAAGAFTKCSDQEIKEIAIPMMLAQLESTK